MQHSRRTDRQVVEIAVTGKGLRIKIGRHRQAEVVGQFSEPAEGCVTGEEEVIPLVGFAIRVREIVVVANVGAEIANPVSPRETGE